jgi:peptide deformylase
MTVRPIRILGDPVLRTPCKPVTTFDESVRALVQDLIDTVKEPGRAGVAAPQIGVSVQAFSYNVDDEIGYVLNPEIISLSGEQDGDEGCLSIPEVWVQTRRALHAVCKGVDLDGREIIVEGTDLMARALQHEVDHLGGMLYIDRLEKGRRRQAMRQIRERNIGA